MKNNLSRDSLIIKSNRPAYFWDEAYPLGNGFMGVMFYGGTEKETLSLNNDTLWSGFPIEKDLSGKTYSLNKAKEYIRQKQYVLADKELSSNFACHVSESYMPLGNVEIEFQKGKIKKYSRALDLLKAVAYSKYEKDGIEYKTSVFASYPRKAVIYKIESSEKNICSKIFFNSPLKSHTYTKNNFLYVEGECPTSKNPFESAKKEYYENPKERGISFISSAEIVTDGSVVDLQTCFGVNNASFIEIRITSATSYNGYKNHPYLNGRDYKKELESIKTNLSECDYSFLFDEHVKDYSKYFRKVSLNLGTNNKSRITTKQRLIEYSKGKEDKALPTLLFNFGRYLTISASRKGSQAMNLQGIWNKHVTPPWRSSYTLNINTEMNYFPTLALGLEEMYEPLITLIKEVSQKGVDTAKMLYGADGWCCHHNTDIWRHTLPSSGDALWMFWNGAGGWLCHHLAEYYEYTLDKKFLKETALPIIEGAVKFYLSQLETVGGYRVVFPSTSPENIFWCEDGTSAVSETTEMTMAQVRELFANYLEFCDVLSINNKTAERVKNEISALLPIKLGKDGRILEWYGERSECAVHHRHVSHLYALMPGNEISFENKELAQACKKVLEVRGDEGTGWSLAWKSNLYARLCDGNRAFDLIKRQLQLKEPTDEIDVEGGGTYPNMFCAHPPFQIDGNFGVTNAIIELFLQSSPKEVHIIPALPEEIKDVYVKGLKGKGNRTVTIKVKKGRLVYCEIKGKSPKRITVCGIDYTKKFTYTKRGCVYEIIE